MGILRKDYILDRWVFYATKRKKRRLEFKEIEKQDSTSPKTCFFCPGNEHLTPKEVGRVEERGIWKIRWFPNKFPAVELRGIPKIATKKGFFTEGKTYGTHEVIVETNGHYNQLSDLNVEHIKEVLYVCLLRIKELSKMKGVKYVSVFKNHGSLGGTSLIHSHIQIASLSIIPTEITDKINVASKDKNCQYCNIIKLESKGKRKILETKNAIAFAPFASRFNYEAWIFPKRHVSNIQLNGDELHDTALLLKNILAKLKQINASYNFFFQHAPEGKRLHFHIEVTPRIAKYGGFELSTGAVINSVMPEDAARFYR